MARFKTGHDSGGSSVKRLTSRAKLAWPSFLICKGVISSKGENIYRSFTFVTWYSRRRRKKDSWVQWAIIILRAVFGDNGEIKSSEPKRINDTG